MKGLRERGYKCFILSNYSEKLLGETRPLMKFLPYMNDAAWSYKYKLIKPDHAFYQKALFENFGITPSHAVMLDDRPDNIEAARSVGMQGIVFQSFEQGNGELEAILKAE